MSLILFLGPQSLKYLLSGPLQKVSAELTEKSTRNSIQFTALLKSHTGSTGVTSSLNGSLSQAIPQALSHLEIVFLSSFFCHVCIFLIYYLSPRREQRKESKTQFNQFIASQKLAKIDQGRDQKHSLLLKLNYQFLITKKIE